MITSQRLIIIFVLFNIFTGVVATIYNNPTVGSLDKTQIVNEQSNVNSQITKANSEDSLYGGIGSNTLVSEQSIGNPLGWGAILINVFSKGFNPISILPEKSNVAIENIFVFLLILVKTMISIILILEIYMIFKNKKTS